jgi:hypothetical protein
MKKTILFLVIAVALTTQTLVAQVPSYVPTNGLLGYWPFNGNANDESGNTNNGTVNAATLTTDRFGVANKAYSFNGVNNYISLQNAFFNGATNVSSFTFCGWFYANSIPVSGDMTISSKEGFWRTTGISLNSSSKIVQGGSQPNPQNYWTISSTSGVQPNTWVFFCFTYNSGSMSLYINGLLDSSYTNPYSNLDYSMVDAGNSTATNLIGAHGAAAGYNSFWNGKIDDFGYWNRVLTQDEITTIYNGNQCFNLITVTDTLIINVGQLSYNNPVTYANNITMAPNPASTQININFNNITDLNGGTLKVINSLGQEVATTPITTSGTQSIMQLATWGGSGMYFVQIINSQGQIVDIKKIILQ